MYFSIVELVWTVHTDVAIVLLCLRVHITNLIT